MANLILQRSYPAVILLASLLADCGHIVGAVAAQGYQPFALFDPKVEIDIDDGKIDMQASFTLGKSSTGLDLTTEALQLRVTGGGRTYSVTIPPGFFNAAKAGRFAYLGTLESVKIVAELRPLRPNAYELELETEGANLVGFANPLTVNLIIGDDGGSRTLRAKIE